MIASANSAPPSGRTAAAARRTPSRTFSIGSASPIFPVAPIATTEGSRSSSSAAARWIATASRIPWSPVAAFALPALTAAARIAPKSRLSRQSRTGAAAAALRVRSRADSQPLGAGDDHGGVGVAALLQAAGDGAGGEPGRQPGRVELLDPAGGSTQRERKKPSL